jgi:hypothetical protein
MITTPSADYNLRARRPTLWYDKKNQSVNCYGGWGYNINPKYTVYTSFFDVSQSPKPTFKNRFGSSNRTEFPFTRKFGGLWAYSDNAYFNLGGIGASTTDPEFSGLDPNYQFTESGLFVLDEKRNFWVNHTMDSNRVHGEAQFIPLFGKDGVVVFIGGDKPTAQSYTLAAALMPMSTVTIYDVEKRIFYDQSTSGEVPVDRSVFCSVAVRGSAANAYEM